MPNAPRWLAALAAGPARLLASIVALLLLAVTGHAIGPDGGWTSTDGPIPAIAPAPTPLPAPPIVAPTDEEAAKLACISITVLRATHPPVFSAALAYNTQVVVKRTKALEGRWRDLNLEGTYWVAALDLLMSRETEDVVLIACKRHKNFKRHLEGLNLLREAGVAEWD